MRILITTDRVIGFGHLQRNGDVIDLCEEEATRLIRSGQAECMEKADPTEIETREVAENASLPTNRRGKLFKRLRS